jgi:hypothetical protein
MDLDFCRGLRSISESTLEVTKEDCIFNFLFLGKKTIKRKMKNNEREAREGKKPLRD